MTCKNVKTTLFAPLIAAMVLPFSVMQADSVFAEHPLPTNYPFISAAGGGVQSICYNTTQMNKVNLDGSKNNINVRLAADAARIIYDQLANMTVTVDSTCDFGDNRAGAKIMGSNDLGIQYDLFKNTARHFVELYINSNLNWSSTSTCGSSEDPNPRYVYNHEFGHFAGLSHSSSNVADNHTLMKPDCSSGYAQLSTEDKKQINGFYQEIS